MIIKNFKVLIISLMLTSCDENKNIDDNKAIAEIEFGVSKTEYFSRIDSTLKNLQKIGGYYKVGAFYFNNIAPDFHQNKLYKITLSGYKYSSFYSFLSATKDISFQFDEKYGTKNKEEYELTENIFDFSNFIIGPNWASSTKDIKLNYLKSGDKYEIFLVLADALVDMNLFIEELKKTESEKDKLKEVF